MCAWQKRQAKSQRWAGLAQGHRVEGGGTSCPGGRGTSSLLGDSQALGQGRVWQAGGTKGRQFGSGNDLGFGESPKEPEGLPFREPSRAPISDFSVDKPRAAHFCTVGPALRTFESVPRIGREGALRLQTCGPR